MARARGGHPPLPWLLLLFMGLYGRVGAFLANPLSSSWASKLVQGSTRPVVGPVRAFQDGEGGKGAKGGGTNPNDEEMAIREAIEKNRRAAEQASKLLERGVTAQQLEAYTGIKLVELPMDEGPTLRVTPSNQFVDRDGDGELKQARFVYVDEYTCIGCTNCASVAPNTFFMEDEHGRARVFKQWGDSNKMVQTAIETCPVDCIHYVQFDELQKLEKERESITINYKARLVGSEGLLSGAGADLCIQEISGNKDMRCLNCPSKGCYNCPMFGVGENPEYKRKREAIQAKRAAKKAEKERQDKRKRLEL